MTILQNELVAKTYLLMFSVAFLATEDILLKVSNLFWYLPMEESFCVRAKMNGLQCFLLNLSLKFALKKDLKEAFPVEHPDIFICYNLCFLTSLIHSHHRDK